MIHVGIDWAEAHHDVCVLGPDGEVLATLRMPEGLEGVARLHGFLAEHAETPGEVIVGIETDRGLLVGAMVCTRQPTRQQAQKRPPGLLPGGLVREGRGLVACGGFLWGPAPLRAGSGLIVDCFG